MQVAAPTAPATLDRPTAAKALIDPIRDFTGHVFKTITEFEDSFTRATISDFAKKIDASTLVSSANAAIDAARAVAPDADSALQGARESVNGVIALVDKGQADTTKLDSPAGEAYPASLISALQPLSDAALVVDPDVFTP